MTFEESKALQTVIENPTFAQKVVVAYRWYIGEILLFDGNGTEDFHSVSVAVGREREEHEAVAERYATEKVGREFDLVDLASEIFQNSDDAEVFSALKFRELESLAGERRVMAYAAALGDRLVFVDKKKYEEVPDED